MASGYGNRSKWTVNEIITRNEQARALGQKGLSETQIGSAVEGAIGADLQAAGVHEQNMMNYKQGERRLDMAQDAIDKQSKANTMGGYIKMGEGLYQGYQKMKGPDGALVNPLTADTGLSRNIIRPYQNAKALGHAQNVPTEEMYGPNTIDATGGAIGATQNYAQEMGGALGDFATQQASGQGTDIVSQLSQGGDFNKALGAGTDALGLTDEVSKGAELAAEGLEGAAKVESMATSALGATGKAVGPVGAAMGAAMSVAGGNYAKAAVDLAIYGIGMAFGPIGMMASMIVSLLPDEWMEDVYGLFS